MKTSLLSVKGEKIKEIELPKLFSTFIREDIMKKVFEAEKKTQPYSPNIKAGKKHSASGISRKLRHVWKSGYGHGRSRIPRKIMWRRGSQFYWIGAETSGTRGGRRAHPPKIASMLNEKKINKKELELAMKSGFASSVNEDKIKSRYLLYQQALKVKDSYYTRETARHSWSEQIPWTVWKLPQISGLYCRTRE